MRPRTAAAWVLLTGCLLVATALAEVVGHASAAGSQQPLPEFPLYKQCDPRWGTDEMGVKGPGERATICKEGCAMSSLSMALHGLGMLSMNPGTLNAWLEQNDGYTCDGGDCNNLVLDIVSNLTSKLTLISESPAPSVEVMRKHLTAGDTIYLAHVHNSGHFVLVQGWDDAKAAFTVRDPFYNTTEYTHDQISDVIAYAIRSDPSDTGARRVVDGNDISRLAELPPSAVVPWPYPIFKQCNHSWGNDTMVTTTICKVGCLMSSTSMALAGKSIAIDKRGADPATLNAFLRANKGYDNDNDMFESVVPKVDPSRVSWPADGMHTSNDLSVDTIHEYLHASRPVIANVMHGGHFVLVVGYDSKNDDVLYINDPGFSRTTYSRTKDVVGWRLFQMKQE